jgi:hypothetical protein
MAYHYGFSVLIDLQDLTSSDALTTADIQQLASSTIDRVARRAFVVSDPATYGLIRMSDSMRSSMSQHEQVRLFKNLADAAMEFQISFDSRFKW